MAHQHLNSFEDLRTKLTILVKAYGVELITQKLHSSKLLDDEENSTVGSIQEKEVVDKLTELLKPNLICIERFQSTLKEFKRAIETITLLISSQNFGPCEGNCCLNCESVALVQVAKAVGCEPEDMQNSQTTLLETLLSNPHYVTSLPQFRQICTHTIAITESFQNQGQRHTKAKILSNIINAVLNGKNLMELQYLLRMFNSFGWIKRQDIGLANRLTKSDLVQEVTKRLSDHLIDAKPLEQICWVSTDNVFLEERDLFRKKILKSWKYLRENLSIDHEVLDLLLQNKFLSTEEHYDLQQLKTEKIRNRFYITMYRVVKKIQNKKGYNSFLEVLNKSNEFITEKLQEEAETIDWQNKVNNVMREKYTLINNSAALAEELAPEELVDDMVEHFIITLKDHENICRRYITEKEMSNLLLEALIENVEKGSYPCLLYLLENSMEARQFEYVGNLLKKELPPTSPETDETVVELETAHLKTFKMDGVTSGLDLKIEISSVHDKRIEETVIERFGTACKWILSSLFSIVKKVFKGSICVYLQSIIGNLKDQIIKSLGNGSFIAVFRRLFNDSIIKKVLPQGQFSVTITAVKSKFESTVSDYQMVQDDIHYNTISVNKQFLLDELDPVTLMNGFSKRGITCFDGMNVYKVRGRKERVQLVLDILEFNYNTLEQAFMDILKEEMVYVYDCLTVQHELEHLDKSVLRSIVIKNFETIAEEVNLHSLRVIVGDRRILDPGYFKKMESNRYTDRKDKMLAILLDIIQCSNDAACVILEAVKRCNNKRFDIYIELIRNMVQNKPQLVGDKTEDESSDDRKLFELELQFCVLRNSSGCNSKSILLLDVGSSMEQQEGASELKVVVNDFLSSLTAHCDKTGEKEHIATIAFGDDSKLYHHFRSNLQIAKLFTEHLPKPMGHSDIIQALDLCRTLIDADGTNRRSLSNFIRIILISDGVFTPDTFIKCRDSDENYEVNKNIVEICTFLEENNAEINCIPVGGFDETSIDKLVEMVDGYPKDPMHFLAKMTKGKLVSAKNVKDLSSERQSRFNESVVKSMKDIISDLEPPLFRIVRQAVEQGITNVYRVLGMLRDAGLEDECPSAVANLIDFFKKKKEAADKSKRKS